MVNPLLFVGLALGLQDAAPAQEETLATVAEWEGELGPEAREHAVFFVPAKDPTRAILFGGSGYAPYGTPLADAWAFDLEEDVWSPLALAGDVPTPAGSRRVAIVPGGTQAYLFGGYGQGQVPLDELHRVELRGETLQFTALESDAPPAARLLHGFGYDPGSNALVVFAGGGAAGFLEDTWLGAIEGDRVRWRRLAAEGGPGPRFGFAYALDARTGSFYVSGGQVPGIENEAALEFASDLWRLDLRAEEPAWTLVGEFEAERFPGRRNGAFVHDAEHGELALWGGTADGRSVVAGLFVVDLAGGEPGWRRYDEPAGIQRRASGFGVHDVARARLLMGFGNTGSGSYRDLICIPTAATRPQPDGE